MNDKLELIRTSGETIQTDLICFFENIQNNKRYVYYTLNEMVGSGPSATVKVYVGKVRQNDANLDMPITEEDWESLKGIMGEVLKGTPNTTIKYLPISALADKTLVSEKVIAMPTSYDYISKHRGVYASSAASSEESGEVITPVVEAPAPIETPVVEAPSVPTEPVVPVENPIPTEPVVSVPIEPTPVVEPVVEAPMVEPTPIASESVPQEATNADLKPINIEEIEAKYAEMIETINTLKNQEIEAAKRYNATLELSSMHNEQHAEYVANEQNKEITSTEPIVNVPVESTPVEETPTIEPTPIEPTPIIPATPVASNDIETNWFDMPNQG